MNRVLLVDDEPFILEGLSVLIDWEKEGFQIVKKASNGRQAYEYLKENTVELIISDIQMPDMNGLDFQEKIRKEKISNAYFIILTGFADFSYAQRAISYDCSEYILKPVDKKELISVLRRITKESKKNTSVIPDFKPQEDDKSVLYKGELDDLVRAINTDDHAKIKNKVSLLFKRFQENGEQRISGTLNQLNINYLVFQLINLASEQNKEIDQQEVLQYINESSFQDGVSQGSFDYMYRFACEYADYLMQLHRQVPSDAIHKVLQEIHNNYAQNLTLKDLSEKFLLNSAYLGQLFKKQYGRSFKDYLNQYRLSKAEELLIKTDKKVYEIAGLVGYKDLDYFVNLFINSRGCTPARFRKQKLSGAL